MARLKCAESDGGHRHSYFIPGLWEVPRTWPSLPEAGPWNFSLTVLNTLLPPEFFCILIQLYPNASSKKLSKFVEKTQTPAIQNEDQGWTRQWNKSRKVTSKINIGLVFLDTFEEFFFCFVFWKFLLVLSLQFPKPYLGPEMRRGQEWGTRGQRRELELLCKEKWRTEGNCNWNQCK